MSHSDITKKNINNLSEKVKSKFPMEGSEHDAIPDFFYDGIKTIITAVFKFRIRKTGRGESSVQ